MWTYVQLTGKIYRDGVYVFTGYAGRGKGLNNPQMQDVIATGPLPIGFYTMTEPRKGKTGPYSMPLIPDPLNTMFGRSAFLIHGDNFFANHTASDGCIALSPLAYRQAMWGSGDHRLRVVGYPSDVKAPALPQVEHVVTKITEIPGHHIPSVLAPIVASMTEVQQAGMFDFFTQGRHDPIPALGQGAIQEVEQVMNAISKFLHSHSAMLSSVATGLLSVGESILPGPASSALNEAIAAVQVAVSKVNEAKAATIANPPTAQAAVATVSQTLLQEAIQIGMAELQKQGKV